MTDIKNGCSVDRLGYSIILPAFITALRIDIANFSAIYIKKLHYSGKAAQFQRYRAEYSDPNWAAFVTNSQSRDPQR